MHKKCIVMTIIAVVVIGGGAFYGGMQYNKSKSILQGPIRNGGGQFFQSQGQGGNRQAGGQRTSGGLNNGSGDFTSGDIISKDDKSITVKTRDGGSKIIYFSDSTTIGKAEKGSASDLSIGQQVMVNGKSGTDGSLAAQNIQIRPEGQSQP